MFSYLRALSLRQLKSLDDQIRLVIVHPTYVHQHVVLSHFYDKQIAYVRFEGRKLNQNNLQQQLEQALELQELKPTDFDLVILDESDRAEVKALTGFLNKALDYYPQARFIIFGRNIPLHLLGMPHLQQQTAFIPNDRKLMLWDYARFNHSDKTLLEVRAFGDGHVYLDGRLVENWDGVLPRSLFFYLVDRGMATRNDIFETFWPNLTSKEATNVFHVTKRKISEVLGIDLTTYWSGFYRISSSVELSYDVILFTEMLQNSAVSENPQDEEDLLRNAIGLYRGNFLHGSDMEWVKKRRIKLSQDYAEALASLAKVKEDQQDYESALGLYLRAATNSRHREDLTASIMQLYDRMQMHDDALRMYEQFCQELQEELHMEPAARLQSLAAGIRQQIER